MPGSLANEMEDADMSEVNEYDVAFLASISYLTQEEDNSQLVECTAQENEDFEVPRNYICFKRGDSRLLIKKASLIWWLSKDEHRVSTDRIYRFHSATHSVPAPGSMKVGDFVVMKFENLNFIVQILSFKFEDGKKFHGTQFKKAASTRQVNALCVFFNLHNGFITTSKREPRLINVNAFKNHCKFERDPVTGKLKYVA